MGLEVPVQTSVMFGVAIAGRRSGGLGDYVRFIGENAFCKLMKFFGRYRFCHFCHPLSPLVGDILSYRNVQPAKVD